VLSFNGLADVRHLEVVRVQRRLLRLITQLHLGGQVMLVGKLEGAPVNAQRAATANVAMNVHGLG